MSILSIHNQTKKPKIALYLDKNFRMIHSWEVDGEIFSDDDWNKACLRCLINYVSKEEVSELKDLTDEEKIQRVLIEKMKGLPPGKVSEIITSGIKPAPYDKCPIIGGLIRVVYETEKTIDEIKKLIPECFHVEPRWYEAFSQASDLGLKLVVSDPYRFRKRVEGIHVYTRKDSNKELRFHVYVLPTDNPNIRFVEAEYRFEPPELRSKGLEELTKLEKLLV